MRSATVSLLSSLVPGPLLVLGFATSACSDSDESTPVTTPLTVWVFDEGVAAGDAATPVASARVAFDPAGGGARVVAVTEADGHVTFDGDFARGGASITVFSDDHVFVTLLEASPETARARPNAFGKPASDLVVTVPLLDRVARDRTVGFSGTFRGRADEASSIDLAASALRRLGLAEVTASSFALRAPRGRPFFLVGHETKSLSTEAFPILNEHLKSFRIDVGALQGDERRDIDLASASALTVKPVRVRLEPPKEASSFGAGTAAYATVLSAESSLLLGPIRKSAPSADTRAFDVEMSVVETDIAPEHLVTRAALVAPDGSRSIRVEPGVVSDGAVIGDFPVPPAITVADGQLSLADAVPLEGFPSGADLLVKLYAGGQLVWVLRGPPGGPRAKSFAVPAFEQSAFPVDIQLLAVSISAESDRVELGPGLEISRRAAIARDLVLRRR